MQLKIWIGTNETYIDLENDLGMTPSEWDNLDGPSQWREITSLIYEYFDYGFEEIRE
jgi:hypothetical protein